MNPVSVFNGIEDNKIRGDQYENMTRMLQPQGIEMKFDSGLILTDEDFLGPIAIRDPKDDEEWITHIFCMSCIHSQTIVREDLKIFDPRIDQFGDTVAFILPESVGKFLEIIGQHLKKLSDEDDLFFARTGLVKYISKKSGNIKMDAFTKTDDYEWQNEFRIGISLFNVSNPYKLQLGN